MTTVAEFTVEYKQFLNQDGEVMQTLPEFAQQKQTLLELYQIMLLTRTFDKKAIALQRTGKMGTYASILGMEAIGAAIGHVMQSDDVLCPAYREYAAQLQRGTSMTDILTYWGGDERGNNYMNNTTDFPICVPIASQCLHAVGAASAIKLRKQKRVAVSVCGDGATSQGDFYEAMNVAGVWQLPVVFVINNNQWAISVPRKLQTASKTIAQKAIAAGFNGEQVDGNDVIAVQEAFQRAVDKARLGKGPTCIEALTYRLCDHTTADDAGRYRPEQEMETAWQQEPLIRLKTHLQHQHNWTPQDEEKLLADCKQKVELAVTAYLNQPRQAPESMFDSLYASLPQPLQEQRDELVEAQKNA